MPRARPQADEGEHPLRKAFDMEYFGWNAFNHGFQIKSGMTVMGCRHDWT